MKSLLICLFCVFAISQLNAAAVDSVVQEEAHTDIVVDGSLVTDAECHQPREIGRCFALFHRYAFNVESRQCEEFIYGGCAGNKNNFESMEDCERKCMKSLDDVQTAAATTQLPGADDIAAVRVAEETKETVPKTTESSA